MILAEIGEGGQSRLAMTDAEVGGQGLAHEVAERYAIRGGMRSVVPGPIGENADLRFLKYDAPRAVVLGARAALRAITATITRGMIQ